MKADCSLKRRERLRGHATFEKIRRKGSGLKGRYLLLTIYPNGLTFNRIGISVSKRAAAKSTRRHRLKRLISESFRQHKAVFGKGLDIVVRCKPVSRDLSLAEIETDFLGLFKKGGTKA